jgi:hypothetical protein
MSPVSRGRKRKKSRSGGGTRFDGGLARRMAGWWPRRAAQVLDGAVNLPTAAGPFELEQATAGLLGGVLHQALLDERGGFVLYEWLRVVLDRAVGRATVADWYLLHGIAAIAPGDLSGQALAGIDRLQRAGLTGPDWLERTPTVEPTGEVRLLRDAYGGRFAVLMECGYPDRTDGGHWYVLDIDTCRQIPDTVDAFVEDTVDAAADAWRAAVGPTAAQARPGPADSELLADLLPRGTDLALGVIGQETRRRMDNYFRAMRRGDDLARVRNLPTQTRWHSEVRDGVDLEPYLKDFQAWYLTTGDRDPLDREVVDALAESWFEGSLAENRLSCSPHRIHSLQERIAIEWGDDPLIDPVATLLPDWVRWCAARTDIDTALTERALAAARRDRSAWDDVPALGAPTVE